MKQEHLKLNINSTRAEDNYITPPWIYKSLGEFDLDPCCPVRGNPRIAKHWFTRMDWSGGGLRRDWFGRVWLNPPYGRDVGKWIRKLAEHGKGTALVFARTDCTWFQDYVFEEADAILFLRGRLTFYDTGGKPHKGNAGAPSVLVSYGTLDTAILRESGLPGKFVRLKAGL